MQKDIRYKQRFENYEKSYLLLQDALNIQNPSLVEKAGVIQFFETTYELAWKLMKDYLDFQGYEIKSPREAIKKAYAIELINHGTTWLEALSDRNLTTHTYDEKMANEVYVGIKDNYFSLLEEFYLLMKEKTCLD